MKAAETTLFSGGARGAEAAFGESAARHGVQEVNFTFVGHHQERSASSRMLSGEELQKGDVTMGEVSKRLKRDYSTRPWLRQVLQSIWHQVNSGFQVFIVGAIQADGTVKGGTGWAAELAKMFNRPLHVFDQDKGGWFVWRNGTWVQDEPRIEHSSFCGTGTRNLSAAGQEAIDQLFGRSFGQS